jgi:hypothetical protein
MLGIGWLASPSNSKPSQSGSSGRCNLLVAALELSPPAQSYGNDNAAWRAQRTEPMPLSERANCELYSNNVYFCMTYGGHRIRCGVTDLALKVLEPKLDLTTARGRLDAFDAHRAFIERTASTKFDRKTWERDGITILVRDGDFNASAAGNG